MRHMNIMTSILVLGAAVALPAAAQQRELPRQPPAESMHDMMQGGMMGMMGMGRGDAAGRERPQLTLALQNRTELGLTEPQEKTLESLIEGFRTNAEQRVGELDAAETQLAALLKQETAGEEVEAQIRRIEKLRADLRLERIRTIAAGRAGLAQEQRAKLDQLVADSGRGMMDMRGGGMEGMDHGARHGSAMPERKE